MQSSPVIYVCQVTSLGEARYCAGMGVQFLGFVATPDQPAFVPVSLYREIMGWVSGPARVVQADTSTEAVAAGYAPEYVHTTDPNAGGGVPLLIETTFRSFSDLVIPSGASVRAILLSDLPDAPELVTSTIGACSHPVWLEMSSGKDAARWLDVTGAEGIFLRGRKEIATGINDYDHLATILEQFDAA